LLTSSFAVLGNRSTQFVEWGQ